MHCGLVSINALPELWTLERRFRHPKKMANVVKSALCSYEGIKMHPETVFKIPTLEGKHGIDQTRLQS